MVRAARALALLLLLLPTATVVGCRGSAPERPRNVLWIVVDSLRADHLGAYGYERGVSPSIDRLAQEGTLYERAIAPAPWTLPSVASMLTGLPPRQHGVSQLGRALHDGLPSLPAILRDRGFRTGAVVSHRLIGRRFGFDRGFEVFDEKEARGHRHVSTPGVTQRAQRLLRELAAGDAPFFLFLHYFDPHYQFRGHDAYALEPRSAPGLTGDESIRTLRDRLDELSDEDVAFLVARYDEEIRATDAGIGQVLATLDDVGLAEDTLVVFTADHGEEFLDRDWLGHTRTLYDELVRVPLVLRGPGFPAGTRIAAPVSGVAVAATVLDALGVGDSGLAGAAPLPRSAAEARGGWVFSEVDYVDRERGLKGSHKKAVVGPRYKLIRDDVTGTVELYDVARDPGEQHDLAARRPGLVRSMSGALEAHIAASPPAPRPADRALGERELRELEALGYVERR